jgi:hypothetical protein
MAHRKMPFPELTDITVGEVVFKHGHHEGWF